MTPPAPVSFEDFCQRLLALFEGGRFTATYKYALLIGLLDVLSERVGPGGEMPDVVRTRDLARAVPFCTGRIRGRLTSRASTSRETNSRRSQRSCAKTSTEAAGPPAQTRA